MSEVIVVGNGPAGISAALYTIRAGFSTTVIGKDAGALAKATEIENYFGFAKPVSGAALLEQGLQQAQRLGVETYTEEVVSIGFTDRLMVSTATGREWAAPSIILATGAARHLPKIAGLAEFEGKGVSFCAACDAFFYRGKNIAVLGSGDYALHEAQTLLPVVGSVTLLTNGRQPTVDIPPGIIVEERKIAEFTGDGVLQRVVFEDGASQEIAGVFIAIGVAGSADLARKLGALTEDNRIVVNEQMATNIPGLFAAGDCTGGLLQIAKAVADGAKAGTAAAAYLRELKA